MVVGWDQVPYKFQNSGKLRISSLPCKYQIEINNVAWNVIWESPKRTALLHGRRVHGIEVSTHLLSISMDDKKYSMRFESMADSKERSSSQFKKLQMNESRHQQVADSRVKLLEGEPKALGAPIFNTIKV